MIKITYSDLMPTSMELKGLKLVNYIYHMMVIKSLVISSLTLDHRD